MASIRPTWTPPLNGSGHFAFGIDVDWTVDVSISAVRWWHPSGEATADVLVKVWDQATETELAAKTRLAAAIVNGWNQVTLDSPVPVTAGVTYTISGETTGAHGYTNSESPPFTSPDGLATIVQTRYQGGGGYPATEWGAGQHGVDVEYSEDAPVEGTLTGDLPELAGQLAAVAVASGVLAGDLPEPGGSLSGAGSAPAALAGELPALEGELTGGIPATGTLAGDLPELIGSITGLSEGGVSMPLRAMRTTTVSIYAPAVAPDEWSGARDGETLIVTGVPASVIEQTRTVNDPRTGTPRVIRQVTGRVPDGTPVAPTSRITDAEGRRYAVGSVRQVRNPAWVGDVVLEMTRLAQDSP